jgi:ankyrin repeat protein
MNIININKDLFDLIKKSQYEDILDILNKNSNIDVNIRDINNIYLISYIILHNNINILKLLLDKNAKIDILEDGKNILYIPIKYGYIEIIKLLILHKTIGVPITGMVDDQGLIPLNYCIEFNNYESFKIILENTFLINHQDKQYNTFIHNAIKKKNYLMINDLINHPSIDINLQNNIGETALHMASYYEDINIINKLFAHKNININIFDHENHCTALIYIIKQNNINITKIFLENNINIELQDIYGNTALHIAILENNIEIANILISKINKFNLTNIYSNTALHTLLTLNLNQNKLMQYNIKKLIKNTNLNIQDIYGNTCLFYLYKYNLWMHFINILLYKKNNIFIKNKDNITIYDMVKNNKYDKYDNFINLIIDSYYNILTIKSTKYINIWKNKCKNNVVACKKKIKENIIKYNISIPLKKKSYYNINVDEGEKSLFTTYVGVSIDIIGGMLLLHKFKKIISTLNNKNLITNDQINTYYLQMGIYKNDFMNYVITWLYQSLFFPENFNIIINNYINDDNINFLIIPLTIEIDIGAHFNIIIIDKSRHIIERMDPSGKDYPPNFNYNPKLLDTLLKIYFKDYFKNFNYLDPELFIPKLGFQAYENLENYKTKKIDDPSGFCIAWCIWYAQNRLKYYMINPKKLIILLIKKIKYNNFTFKNIIRNYANLITDYRDNFLNYVNIDINDFLNDQYDVKILYKIQNYIHNII